MSAVPLILMMMNIEIIIYERYVCVNSIGKEEKKNINVLNLFIGHKMHLITMTERIRNENKK